MGIAIRQSHEIAVMQMVTRKQSKRRDLHLKWLQTIKQFIIRESLTHFIKIILPLPQAKAQG